MFHPTTATTMSSAHTNLQQPGTALPRATPSPPSTEAEAAPGLDIGAGACIQNVLHDLVRQAAQRAWQARQRAEAEAQALQARNAFD